MKQIKNTSIHCVHITNASDGNFTIYPTPYNRKIKCVDCVSLNKTFPSIPSFQIGKKINPRDAFTKVMDHGQIFNEDKKPFHLKPYKAVIHEKKKKGKSNVHTNCSFISTQVILLV